MSNPAPIKRQMLIVKAVQRIAAFARRNKLFAEGVTLRAVLDSTAHCMAYADRMDSREDDKAPGAWLAANAYEKRYAEQWFLANGDKAVETQLREAAG